MNTERADVIRMPLEILRADDDCAGSMRVCVCVCEWIFLLLLLLLSYVDAAAGIFRLHTAQRRQGECHNALCCVALFCQSCWTLAGCAVR